MIIQLLRNKLVVAARKSMGKNASLGQLYGNMQEAYNQMQTPLVYQDSSARVSLLTFIHVTENHCLMLNRCLPITMKDDNTEQFLLRPE